jgi:SAM-dependent methyltransferase
MIDWGAGRYERTAAELAPVAERVVSLAGPDPGARVLDLACGTGNAALCAARGGASAIGLDAAPRLIDVARERAASEGTDASFVVGDVQALPFDDASFDVALSIFGVIFAADAAAAFDEMIRVLRPGGRALLSVWIPAGPIDAMVGVLARAMAEATGPPPARFPWHDVEAVTELAGLRGVEARFHAGELSVTAVSPDAYFAANEENHPMSLAGREQLERAGTYASVREQALSMLREGNERPDGFLVSSPYRVIDLRLPDETTRAHVPAL